MRLLPPAIEATAIVKCLDAPGAPKKLDPSPEPGHRRTRPAMWSKRPKQLATWVRCLQHRADDVGQLVDDRRDGAKVVFPGPPLRFVAGL